MSVSTPILTTSSEIWALAAPLVAASTRPAATVAASDFMVSSPRLFVEGFVARLFVAGASPAGKADIWAWRLAWIDGAVAGDSDPVPAWSGAVGSGFRQQSELKAVRLHFLSRC